jgi:hypothetical protein
VTDGPNQGPNGICHYRASEDPVNPRLNPATAFDTLFDGVLGTDPAVGERIRRERKSVIDLVRSELKRTRAEMPAADKARLDAHLDSLRTMEERLAQVTAAGADPSKYTEGDIQDFNMVTCTLQFGLCGTRSRVI